MVIIKLINVDNKTIINIHLKSHGRFKVGNQSL